MATTQKRIFITGASGYIGKVITEFAIAQGYVVRGLTRSDSGAEQLRALGAEPVRGDLTSLDILRVESAAADQVISLASDYGVTSKSYDDSWPVDRAAFDAMAEGVAGTDKPLLTVGGTLFAAPNPSGGETDETSPQDPNPINTRIQAEIYFLKQAEKGIRVISVRLAPYVYGRGGSGVLLFMNGAAQAGAVTSVGGGTNHVTTVHVDDAARLFLLAAEKGKAGEAYNAATETNVTAGQLFSAIGEAVGVPVRDMSVEEAEKVMGGPLLPRFLKAENRASGEKAVRELGWTQNEPGILEDIKSGSYKAVAEDLRK